MAEIQQYQIGQKVKYMTFDRKWLPGKIHGISTSEAPGGIITEISYLIDTGKTAREDVYEFDKKGRPSKTFAQPEQITVWPNQIKPL